MELDNAMNEQQPTVTQDIEQSTQNVNIISEREVEGAVCEVAVSEE